jgi:SAM-dependent methyltransferase
LAWNAKSILSHPFIFELFQSLVGARGCHREFLAKYVQPKTGEHLLDIGCGVGSTLGHLPPEVRYTGVDVSAAYIKAARARFGERGTFVCSDVGDLSLENARFDHAIAIGVLHHLDDALAHSLLRLARSALRPGRRLVTIDPCYSPEQSKVARFVISRDRGRFVRDAAGYRHLFDSYGTAEVTLVHDLLRIPYTHLIAIVDFSGASSETSLDSAGR